ncbi:VCBS repeat-containing protein [Chitinibacter bivalviorum]|uniref:VCBS repeat-containing protein n=1 Tax=Chitinibacter bivalviorum TaxID=2739434 RepID=A0A7H9BES7_9NEIS|nr:VCBS repeat-containing protein [Chitinibacter bivalviorum]QLG87220.1 VCBS repeat-containing protein [Chitinibacter bivalviorum]
MRIVESNVALSAQRAVSREQSQKMAITIEAPRMSPPPANETVNISSAAKMIDDQQTAINNDPKLQLIIQMIEKLTGQKIDLRYFHLNQSGDSLDSNTQGSIQNSANEGGTRIDLHQQESESEQTQFNASGVVKTEDGREISFAAQLKLARTYEQTLDVSIASGSLARPKKDPLVLNYAAPAVTLSDQTMKFDIDSDGKADTIHQLNAGSAYLALDLNHDGKINNGKELFGTQSGNGFADLAQYDQDKNGWIDSGDQVFGQLKLWLKDSSGQDQLNSLTAMKVGAIYLGYARADFDLNNAQNQNLGQIRSSGIYLNEDGSGGNLQQLDLSV